MKNVLVVLFPEEEYFGTAKDSIHLFNKRIESRYADKKYSIKIVNYKGSLDIAKEVFSEKL